MVVVFSAVDVVEEEGVVVVMQQVVVVVGWTAVEEAVVVVVVLLVISLHPFLWVTNQVHLLVHILSVSYPDLLRNLLYYHHPHQLIPQVGR